MTVNAMDISKSITRNNSLINIPQTVVEHDSELVNLNPFISSYDYVNNLDRSESNDIKLISSLDDESSTLRGFFMSEMERMTTIKTITGMNLK